MIYAYVLVKFINHGIEDSKTVIIPSFHKLTIDKIENRINQSFYGYKVISIELINEMKFS